MCTINRKSDLKIFKLKNFCKQGSLILFLKDGSTMPMNITVIPSITGKINRVPLKEEDLQFLKGECRIYLRQELN